MSTNHRDSYSSEADAEHMRFCENDPSGPACKVRKEIEEMRNEMETIKIEQVKQTAVLGFWKWALPVMVSVASVLASLLGSWIKARHG